MQTFHEFTYDYTIRQLTADISILKELCDDRLHGNIKVIDAVLDQIYNSTYESPELNAALGIELDRFNTIVQTVLEAHSNHTPKQKLLQLVKWFANNGIDPSHGLCGNAVRRERELKTKLGFE